MENQPDDSSTSEPINKITETEPMNKISANDEEAGANFCLGKLDGSYKYKHDCNAFYRCVLGTTKLKRCSEGLLFNAADEVCDWPGNVQC